MNKAKDSLTEWAVNFIRSKDAFAGNLKSIEKDTDGFDLKIVYNDKEELVIVEPFIKDADKIISMMLKEKYVSLFLFNSFENFNFLVNNWKRLIGFEKLTIYFVNMFSNTDKKWAIKPYLHNLISDDKKLKEGLNSMFMAVEPLTEDSMRKV